MRIYIVSSGHYSDYRIEGIYADPFEAHLHAENIRVSEPHWSGMVHVEERELDSAAPQLSMVYRAELRTLAGIRSSCRWEIHREDLELPQIDVERDRWGGVERFTVVARSIDELRSVVADIGPLSTVARHIVEENNQTHHFAPESSAARHVDEEC